MCRESPGSSGSASGTSPRRTPPPPWKMQSTGQRGLRRFCTARASRSDPAGLEDERIELQQARAPLERLSPRLAAGFNEWLEMALACAAMSESWPACFSHGDFSPSQLIFSDDQCGLIDFDTICQAEPALDLGHFLAYLRLTAGKACDATSTDGTDTTERVCARFVETYMKERRW